MGRSSRLRSQACKWKTGRLVMLPMCTDRQKSTSLRATVASRAHLPMRKMKSSVDSPKIVLASTAAGL
eukprot:1143481-Alexandrium_andersonii.AAC.1